MGDSRRPLCFLILSALTNTGLDILFVGGMGMGIAGAALATVVSRGLSALLIFAVLTWERSGRCLDLCEIRVNRQILRRICSIGLPTAVQNAILSFSNVFVQSYINRVGSACMAAWTSYGKIEAVVLLQSSALATANTVFGGQNLGAEKTDRAYAGTRCALRLGLGVTARILIPILLFALRLIGLFNQDAEVLRYGMQLVRLMASLYLISVVDQIFRSVLNGAGLTRFTMLATLGGYVLSRQACLLLARKQFGTYFAIILGYPLGWTVCCGTLIYGYCRIRKSMRKPWLAF